jgi:hypothetical protein
MLCHYIVTVYEMCTRTERQLDLCTDNGGTIGESWRHVDAHLEQRPVSVMRDDGIRIHCTAWKLKKRG